MKKYTIPFIPTSLNEHENLSRSHWSKGSKDKEEMTMAVFNTISPKSVKIEDPCYITFHWFVNNRFDRDNIRFAAKYILDGMVARGILKNDSPKWVKGFGGDYFTKVTAARDTKVDIYITTVDGDIMDVIGEMFYQGVLKHESI